MDWSFPSVDNISAALQTGINRSAALAAGAKALGARHMQEGNYALAVADFRRTLAFDPSATDAYRLMGASYAAMDRVDEAVRSYRSGLEADPTFVDMRNDLAKLLMTNERLPEAELEFKRIAETNPMESGVVASLGWIQLRTERPVEALATFERATRLAPKDAAAHYSVASALVALGRDGEAIDAFEHAIELRPDYAAAHADLAGAYLRVGRKEDAKEQVNELYRLGTSESVSLANDVAHDILKPKIQFFDITRSTFNPLSGIGTTVASLDPALATPGAMVTMTMTFEFNQDMDLASVQNVLNWTIKRAQGGEAGAYNNGVTLDPSREATIGPIPTKVVYDPVNRRATVYFKVSQNALGNAVMDPRHWVFQFSGRDAEGRAMDPDGDEFDWYAARSF